MTKLQFQPLSPIRFPLIARFYKTHYPTSKPKSHDCIWAAENEKGIQGVVRFQRWENSQLLTGMTIATEARQQGIGHRLLEAVASQCQQLPCYCFAYAHLTAFYQKHGFQTCDLDDLPSPILEKWQQIQRSKKAVVLLEYRP